MMFLRLLAGPLLLLFYDYAFIAPNIRKEWKMEFVIGVLLVVVLVFVIMHLAHRI
jgi:hypothetical protein